MKAGTLRLLAHQLWATREGKCLSIIERALSLLRHADNLPETEVELNRRLYFCLLCASRELYPDDEIAPVAECNNQPDPDDEARAKREQKRPDFHWIFLDRYEPDARRSSKQFVVECKRLGKPSRADWVLNLNYSSHGVVRFRDPEWAYAKLMQSGAMIGYWQSIDEKDVLQEVNSGCKSNSLPTLVLIGAWNLRNTSRLEHTLQRPLENSPLKLRHLWIDLRSDPDTLSEIRLAT
jgi:hypothetical protein